MIGTLAQAQLSQVVGQNSGGELSESLSKAQIQDCSMCTQNCLDLSVSNFVAAIINLSKLPTPVVTLCTCSVESPVWQQNKTAMKIYQVQF